MGKMIYNVILYLYNSTKIGILGLTTLSYKKILKNTILFLLYFNSSGYDYARSWKL